MKNILRAATLTVATLCGMNAMAIPSLQLGPDPSDPDWYYDSVDETWSLSSFSGSLYAYANAIDGNGNYAWQDGTELREAYLSISASPKTEISPAFDVSISNNGGVTLIETGVGAPPLADADDLKNDDLAPHDVFDTYFEIYRFVFDESALTIGDTQPGGTGTGNGFLEIFDITVNSLAGSVDGVHFDLFTLNDIGLDNYGDGIGDQVLAFAPFSHDAAFVPEPANLALLGIGLIGLGIVQIKRGRRRTYR